jgi:hypothetical protein
MTQPDNMHETSRLQQRKELVLLDESNPRSMINLVPDPVAKQLKILWDSSQKHLLCYPEHGLRGELYRKGKSPTAIDNQIRLNFWIEYDYVQTQDAYRIPKMNMGKVIAHLIAKEAFYSGYITDRYKLAWLMYPPVSYEMAQNELLNLSIEKLREFVEKVKLVDEKGQTNVAVLREFVRIEQIIHARSNGLSGGVRGTGKTKQSLSKALEEGSELAPRPAAPDSLPAQPTEDPKEKERRERRERIAALQKQKNDEVAR